MSGIKRQIDRKMNKPSKRQSMLSGLGGAGGSEPGDAAGWGDVDWPQLIAFVVDFTEAGGAVMLGKSRDGFALNLMLLHEGERVAKWFKAAELADGALDLFLSQVRQHLEASGNAP